MTYLNSTPPSVNSSSQSPKGMSYNDAKSQGEYDLIPKGTIARVMMGIKPGGYSDPEKGWHDGYATYKSGSEAVYLNCEFMVLDGPYRGRKIWSLIGLHSPKGDQWFQMGRSFIRGILNSARGFSEKDTSEAAVAARYISSFKDLHGIEFVASIDVDRNKESGEDKNVIKLAITKDHKDYPGHDSGYYAVILLPLQPLGPGKGDSSCCLDPDKKNW